MIPVGIVASGRSSVTPSVTKAYDASWHVKAVLTPSTKAAAWDVQRTLSSPATKASAWKVYARITATKAAAWDVESDSGYSTVTSTKVSTWDVLEAVPQSKDAAWRVLDVVAASTAASTWDVLETVPQSSSSAWDVLTAVPQSKSSAWKVNSTASASVVAGWNVGSNLVSVTGTKATAWHVKAEVPVSTKPAAWDVLETVAPQTKALAWVIDAQVPASVASAWAIDAQVSQTKDAAWRVLADSGASSPAAYVNSSTNGDSLDNVHTFSKPSGVVAGDLVIGAFQEWAPVTISSLPSGAVLIGQWSTTAGMNGSTIRLTLWAKTVGAETSYTVTSASDVWGCHQGVFYTRWNSSMTLTDLVETSTTGAMSTTIPSVGSTVAGMSAAVWFAANDDDGNVTHTPPTGFTERLDNSPMALATKDNLSAGTLTASGGTSNLSTTWIVALLEVPGEASGETLTSVTQTSQSAWHVKAEVAQLSTSAWNVASNLVSVTSTKAAAWHVKDEVTQFEYTAWVIDEQVTQSEDTAWNVEEEAGATSVTSFYEVSWDIDARITPATKDVAWHVKAEVPAATKDAAWHVKATIAPSTKAAAWDVLETIALASKAAAWNVQSALVSVTATKVAAWAIDAQIAPSTKDAAWHVKATIAPSTKAAAWHVAAPTTSVTATKDAAWHVKATIAPSTKASAWNVAAEQSATVAFVRSHGTAAGTSGNQTFNLAANVPSGNLLLFLVSTKGGTLSGSTVYLNGAGTNITSVTSYTTNTTDAYAFQIVSDGSSRFNSGVACLAALSGGTAVQFEVLEFSGNHTTTPTANAITGGGMSGSGTVGSFSTNDAIVMYCASGLKQDYPTSTLVANTVNQLSGGSGGPTNWASSTSFYDTDSGSFNYSNVSDGSTLAFRIAHA